MYISENVKNLIPFTDLSKIYFVADFDKTITKSDSQSSWSVIAHSKKLPKSYSIERKNLFEYYRPIELDETFDKNEKSILMEEWLVKMIQLIIKYEVTEEVFKDIINNTQILQLRDGVKTFFEILYKNNIPIIIISAGLGNVIECFLKNNGCLYENVFISSNKLLFKNGIANKVDKKIIHSLNKNEISLPKTVTEKLKNRDTVVLLGDQTTDLNMVDNLSKNSVINIGFYVDENTTSFDILKEYFDIVCDTNEDYNNLSKVLF